MKDEIKIRNALVTEYIIPEIIIWIATGVCMITTGIKILTTLLYGFGTDYSSIKAAIIFGIATALLVYIGLGKRKTLTISILNYDIEMIFDNKVCYSIDKSKLQCTLYTESKDIILLFKHKHRKVKIRLEGKDIGILKFLTDNGIKIKRVDDSIKRK